MTKIAALMYGAMLSLVNLPFPGMVQPSAEQLGGCLRAIRNKNRTGSVGIVQPAHDTKHGDALLGKVKVLVGPGCQLHLLESISTPRRY